MFKIKINLKLKIIDASQVKTYFSSLSQSSQEHLLKSLSSIQIESDYTELLQLRGDALDDKRSECPHCQSPNKKPIKYLKIMISKIITISLLVLSLGCNSNKGILSSSKYETVYSRTISEEQFESIYQILKENISDFPIAKKNKLTQVSHILTPCNP